MTILKFTMPALFAALTIGSAQAGLRTTVATTHVVVVGQAYLDKAIHVRETAPRNVDVEAVAEAFRKQGAEVHTLAEQQLTRDALKSVLEQVAKSMKPMDSLVFYFSGFSDQLKVGPALFVQGVGGKPEQLMEGNRILPWSELQGWLTATGAPSLFVILETGREAARFCGPWATAGQIPAMTVVCAKQTGLPGKVGDLVTTLVNGLDGEADGNGDGLLTGDELAAWLRLNHEASVYQTGPVTGLLGENIQRRYEPRSDAGKAVGKAVQETAITLPAPMHRPEGEPLKPVDKLDALLRAIAEQATDSKSVAGLLEKGGIAAGEGFVPVEIAVAKVEDLPRVLQRIEQLGGNVDATSGNQVYARLAPIALKQFAECEAVWSVVAALPGVMLMR